jgi:cytochrome P450
MLSREAADLHKPFAVWQSWFQQFPRIMRLNLVAFKLAVLFQPDDWATVVRAAGRTPGPLQLLPWLQRERDMKKQNPAHPLNLIALEGEEWRANRTVLDAVFSSLPRLQSYLPELNSIGDDLIHRFQATPGAPPTGVDLYRLMYGFSNEVIGQVVFGRRLGNLSTGPRAPLAERFTATLIELFEVLAELQMSMPWYAYVRTPSYRRFCRLVDDIEAICDEYIKLADAQRATSPTAGTDLLTHMREQHQDEARVRSNASTMFLAGSDSTTHTLMWLLYNLGRFPAVQARLREEVDAVVGQGPLTAAALNQMKYLRATLKESMRLTPSAAGLVRVLPQPITIQGYHIPAGVLINMLSWVTNKSAQYFDEPDDFKPERWLRTDDPTQRRPHPWAHIPFGAGPRICQAFRLAELEAYVCAVKLVQHFEWRSLNTVEPRLDMFVKPDRPVHIDWQQRARPVTG